MWWSDMVHGVTMDTHCDVMDLWSCLVCTCHVCVCVHTHTLILHLFGVSILSLWHIRSYVCA